MRGIFLDDERIPNDVYWITYPNNIDWEIVRTFDEFCDITDTLRARDLRNLVVSFDHDIDDDQFTGKDAVNYLVNHILDKEIADTLPTVFVHSKNPVGAANISGYWNSFIRGK